MRTYFKLFAITFLILLQTTVSRADEGMWIPLLLEQLNEKEMQDMGMRITAKDIYDINNSSMKDAILLFGRGCTAEIISEEGLILTNHHCGYRQVQSHSTIEHDYLTDGFWAMDQGDELSNPGLTVTRLVRMEDVSAIMLEGVEASMTEKTRDSVLKVNGDKIKEEAEKDNHYKAYVRPFYYGNEFYLFVTEVFKDIRLVGVPPSNIGKFGGDTDNWMWPRHTGDFSLFRIYVNKDNAPAEYAEGNVPYKPLHSLPISVKGVEEDDFTFIFGFPGRTQEYLPSDAIEMITEVQNPARIELRRQKLDIYESYMGQDTKVRIQYSAKHAGLSNGWKKWIGENKGIMKLDGIKKKQAYENEFNKWANSSPELKKKYGGLLDGFDATYQSLSDAQEQYSYLIEAGLGIEIVRAARQLTALVQLSQKEGVTDEEIQKEIDGTINGGEKFYKDYYMPIDKKVFVKMLGSYRDYAGAGKRPPVFDLIDTKYKGDIQKYADDLYNKSMFSSEGDVMAFLKKYKKSKYKKILKDPAYQLASGFIDFYRKNTWEQLTQSNAKIDSMMRIYMKAQMEMEPGKRFYPDANSTLRVAYGKVKPYYPRDAVFYDYQTTLEGILEKEDPNIYDYVVENKLKELYESKDYGVYGDDGEMPVCFIATNHTTGGNSGSPAFNADGELIGLNFDRCWEGTMSDLMFDPDQCRNIMLDVRYFLFIVDKFAGAGHLVDEMVIVE
ncbi:MAG: serine protease [Bacteroidetes bacterium 4484_276]|nr:MAG: serine protease [Bacteroidetes bacterium 4484_276]